MSTRIYILGIRRSGIHFVANWIASQFEGAVIENNADLLLLKTKPRQRLVDAQTQVIILEDYPVEETLAQLRDDKSLRAKLGADATEHRVLLLRDPFNMAASRVKHYELLSAKGRWVDKRGAMGQWVTYADEFMLDRPVVKILYNEFCASEAARKKVCEQVGGTFNDDALSRVDDNGLGSSFDGLEFSGNGDKMQVDCRWRVYKDCAPFMDMFTSEIRRTAEQIFGRDIMLGHEV